jgi:hypothetical protein
MKESVKQKRPMNELGSQLERESKYMSNFKRKKCKRSPRCTLCTKYRWMGNAKAKKRIRDLRKTQDFSPTN